MELDKVKPKYKYGRMKLIFDIDSECDICQDEIKRIENYFTKVDSKEYYGSKDSKRCFLPHIIIRPDFNSCGIMTHWHIEFSKKEGV